MMSLVGKYIDSGVKNTGFFTSPPTPLYLNPNPAPSAEWKAFRLTNGILFFIGNFSPLFPGRALEVR
jgi:hypothetical protein